MVEWITNTMDGLGYLGIGLLMFLENLFPPIPSELIMPLAGFTIAQGKMTFWGAVVSGVVGTMLGALPWYYIGALVGTQRLYQLADRYGKWLGLGGQDIHRASEWFERHGSKAVFLCRLVPGVRTLISIPAGINKMPLGPFLIYSTAGTTLWVLLLTYIGFVLGKNYSRVEEYLGPVSKLVLAGLLLLFLAWLGWKGWQKRQQKNEV
jgi:membrane protein DedA with SNARE-associated domain